MHMAEKMDWNSPYFNRTQWLFDHLETLNIGKDEALLLLVINSFNEKNEPIFEESLMEKTHLNPEELDEAIELLSAKGYLFLDTRNRQIDWSLAGVLDTGSAPAALSENLIDAFTETFARPLSGSEMERIVQMASQYEEKNVLRALDEAAVYEKLSFGYIESILANRKAREEKNGPMSGGIR